VYGPKPLLYNKCKDRTRSYTLRARLNGGAAPLYRTRFFSFFTVLLFLAIGAPATTRSSSSAMDGEARGAAHDFHARHHGGPCHDVLFALPRPPCCTPTPQGRGGNPAMRDFRADRAAHDEEEAVRDEQEAAAARGR
jgi:hypothetical protein